MYNSWTFTGGTILCGAGVFANGSEVFSGVTFSRGEFYSTQAILDGTTSPNTISAGKVEVDSDGTLTLKGKLI